MKTITLFIFTLIICQVSAQELIEETYQSKNNKKFVSAEKGYFHNQRFLNPDSSITDKRFFNKTGKQIFEHNFKSIDPLIKMGRQIRYIDSGNDTVYFDNNIPTGIWNVNDFFKGKRMILDYNFEIKYCGEGFDSAKMKQEIDELYSKPFFPNGGAEGFKNYIYENRYYDVSNIEFNDLMALENPRIVKLLFDIDSTGKITNICITHGIHPVYDKEAVRLLREAPSLTPGFKDGRPVSTKHYYGIHFQRAKEFE